jgi:hypothetical protein
VISTGNADHSATVKLINFGTAAFFTNGCNTASVSDFVPKLPNTVGITAAVVQGADTAKSSSKSALEDSLSVWRSWQAMVISNSNEAGFWCGSFQQLTGQGHFAHVLHVQALSAAEFFLN